MARFLRYASRSTGRNIFIPIWASLVAVAASRAGDPEEDIRKLVRDYYAGWVGVRAPEIGVNATDHDGKPVVLSSFRGRRVLLFSFDAGNFNRAPDEKALFANLRALDKARKAAGRDGLAVVGFTQGMDFTWPGAPRPAGELGRLSDFPIINTNAALRRVFDEPYNLLVQPSAILLDRKGAIRAIYDHAMTEDELTDAASLGDWDRPVRPTPVEDPWSGQGPPKPSRRATLAWTREIPGVVGMTQGDWDLRGANDLIIAVAGELIVLDPETGQDRHRFAVKEISGKVPSTLGWAKLDKDRSGLFLFHGGWPKEVPIVARDGTIDWVYSNFSDAVNAVNCVAWVDLDGHGSKSLVVGFVSGALHSVNSRGHARWKARAGDTVWAATGVDARDGRQGVVIAYSDGKVKVIDSRGEEVGTIPTEGHDVTTVSASEMDVAGSRQVVAVRPAIVGASDFAVATDLGGKRLWSYPVNTDKMIAYPPPVAVDITGDGTKEWIFAPSRRELVVLDHRGLLVARLETSGKGWSAWTAVERQGRDGWIVAAETGKVSAYSLSPIAARN